MFYQAGGAISVLGTYAQWQDWSDYTATQGLLNIDQSPIVVGVEEGLGRLIEWAFEHPEVEQVTAETLPDLARSIRVMEKCGMRLVGEGKPEGDIRTVRYAVNRAELRSILE